MSSQSVLWLSLFMYKWVIIGVEISHVIKGMLIGYQLIFLTWFFSTSIYMAQKKLAIAKHLVSDRGFMGSYFSYITSWRWYVLWYPVQCTYFILQVIYDVYCGTQYNVRILYYKLDMICIVVPCTMYVFYITS